MENGCARTGLIPEDIEIHPLSPRLLQARQSLGVSPWRSWQVWRWRCLRGSCCWAVDGVAYYLGCHRCLVAGSFCIDGAVEIHARCDDARGAGDGCGLFGSSAILLFETLAALRTTVPSR